MANLVNVFEDKKIKTDSIDLSFLSQFNNLYIFPGFVDVHVHLREPGFLYKETIKTGTLASARGGYTTVCPMPNLKPVPDSLDNLQVELDAIKKDAVVRTIPYGSITKGELGQELSEMEKMAEHVVAFSDDGKGVQNNEMMEQAMLKAKSLGKIIVAHCEDNSLLDGGYIHKGEYAKLHNHKGIPSESEWKQIERDLELVQKTGCAYHVCHVSTKESVELIRKAKAEGLDVTCETAPHYLILNDMDLQEDGRFKMNPPIRSEEDRLALIDGINDGTIDMIATDHAPHSAEEKSKGLSGSMMGVVGLEVAFPMLYTKLVKTNKITINKLIEVLHTNPLRRFGLEENDDFSVWELDEEYEINPEEFLSMGRSTPFAGEKVYGKCLLTVCNDKVVYVGASSARP
ncbi:MAG: dihydroorotase [Clostridiales bacterium]|nr:dihydroorotase [Clostridiales bacterium]